MSGTKRVVMFSSGAGSWAAAKRVVDKHGPEGVVLLFADTKIEDEDNYRFLEEAAANVGAPLVRVVEGRTPWEVFFDVRFLGNTRIDPCSRVLKREPLRKWLNENCDPEQTVVYVGIGWDEEHRLAAIKAGHAPYGVEAPMCDKPYLDKSQVLEWMRSEGIEPPRLYAMGFPHANCGGFCIKAGQAHFKNLLRHIPERYAEHEANEERFRAEINGTVAILRDRRGGKTKPLPLAELRARIEDAADVDEYDWGGCACFVDPAIEPDSSV